MPVALPIEVWQCSAPEVYWDVDAVMRLSSLNPMTHSYRVMPFPCGIHLAGLRDP